MVPGYQQSRENKEDIMKAIQITPTTMGIDHITLKGHIMWVVHREMGVNADKFELTDAQLENFMELYEKDSTGPDDIVNWYMNEVYEDRLELIY